MNKAFKRLSMSRYKKTRILTVNSTVNVCKGHVLRVGDVCNVLVVSVIDTMTLRVALPK